MYNMHILFDWIQLEDTFYRRASHCHITIYSGVYIIKLYASTNRLRCAILPVILSGRSAFLRLGHRTSDTEPRRRTRYVRSPYPKPRGRQPAPAQPFYWTMYDIIPYVLYHILFSNISYSQSDASGGPIPPVCLFSLWTGSARGRVTVPIHTQCRPRLLQQSGPILYRFTSIYTAFPSYVVDLTQGDPVAHRHDGDVGKHHAEEGRHSKHILHVQ